MEREILWNEFVASEETVSRKVKRLLPSGISGNILKVEGIRQQDVVMCEFGGREIIGRVVNFQPAETTVKQGNLVVLVFNLYELLPLRYWKWAKSSSREPNIKFLTDSKGRPIIFTADKVRKHRIRTWMDRLWRTIFW